MERIAARFAAVLALVASLFAAAPAAWADLLVLAPPDGATLGSMPVTLIGTGATDAVEITITTPKKVINARGKHSGKAFTAEIDLDPGESVILVKSGVLSQRVLYTYAPGGTSSLVYQFHPPVADGDCKACHPQGVGRTSPVTEARLCNTCHDPQTGYKRLHGPLGAGQCSICHDPHGSAFPSFLVMGVRALCVQCHAQSNSQTHIDKSANKQCPECHNPHGSEKQFLLK